MARTYPKDQVLRMYRSMYLIRRFEERCAQAYGQGKINGFCHLYIGQEAVAAGVTEALHPTDYILSAYRDHGYALTRGADPGMVLAELFGRATGYSKGKGGSMHIYDIEHHVLGGYGIVGGQIPLAAGTAFASRYRNEDRITVCYFGEAAANQGSFHETLNMAGKWKLPVIFLCENNRYGMGTAMDRVSAVPEVYKRAVAYKIRGEPVDGRDVLQVYEAVKDCAAHCRAGKGPVLLEANTYRYRGHSMSDAATYRSKEEVEAERKADPIPKLRAWALGGKVAGEADFDGIEAEVKATVDAAVRFADASPEPAVEEVWTDHLVEPGERDVPPRERVHGVKVEWPSHPSGQELRVTWELEPHTRVDEGEPTPGLRRRA
ncbi:MAG TPA: pyruvate dehydrogenase (acetyl-transferring) E1 component subunit alpha [Myxococcaceae bacterium]|nr:pyruvate dehydrogenase (acetyl-transferring) E1 component subunit alpha [Myxococcaceae bacterium]